MNWSIKKRPIGFYLEPVKLLCFENVYFITVKPRLTAGFGAGNIRGKSGFAVNRGFTCLQYAYKPYLGEEIGRSKSGFAVNRGVVNRGFTVYIHKLFMYKRFMILCHQ